MSPVTAVYFGEQYLEPTIHPIIKQNYANLECILIDDGSTDGAPEIFPIHQPSLSYSTRQANQGLHATLNAGFAQPTGEILDWLNSSDLLQINGLFVVGSVFGVFSEVEWITGRPMKFSPSGMTMKIWSVPRWSRVRFLVGPNKWIQ